MAKKSKDDIIFLDDFCTRIGTKVSKVFTGRDRGEEVRNDSKIDDVYAQYHHVKVVVPDGTFSITASFLEEFFVNIVLTYGLDTFRETVEIVPNGYEIDEPFEEAIQRILQRGNALSKNK